MTDDRGQRADDRRQRTEGRSRKQSTKDIEHSVIDYIQRLSARDSLIVYI